MMEAEGVRDGWRSKVRRRKDGLRDLKGNSSVSENCISPCANGRVDFREYERELSLNPTFRERIKAIERLALRYAPLEGDDVDALFNEIEWAKEVLDGVTPPPPAPKRKSKRKKKQ